ncbi:hypothetical protein BDZ97DRAFT_1736542 [Flammula alnicola]|nr:hypothetical protein BDZ97DRAFT_1736542 [Flammula alnicola]
MPCVSSGPPYKLVTGRFHGVDDNSLEDGLESAARVTHTSLKHLHISCLNGIFNPHLSILINLLDLPSVESFVFDTSLSPYFHKDELISLFARSGSPLVSLDISEKASPW